MFKTEAQLFHHLKSILPGNWVRIESVVGTGVPDVSYAIDGVTGWTELKIVHNRFSETMCVSVRFRKEQYAWLMKQRRHGIVSVTVGFVNPGTRKILVVPASNIEKLYSGEFTPRELGVLVDGGRDDAEELRYVYTTFGL